MRTLNLRLVTLGLLVLASTGVVSAHDGKTASNGKMEQAINYRARIDNYDDLARYDGSVIVERTKGEISARCDK